MLCGSRWLKARHDTPSDPVLLRTSLARPFEFEQRAASQLPTSLPTMHQRAEHMEGNLPNHQPLALSIDLWKPGLLYPQDHLTRQHTYISRMG